MPYYPNFLSKDPAGLTSAAGGQGIQVYAYNSNDPNLPRPWLDAVARGKYGGFADARLRFKKNYYSDGGGAVGWSGCGWWGCPGLTDRPRAEVIPAHNYAEPKGDCGGHADKGGSYGGFSSSACKTNPGGMDCFNQMVRAMHPQRQGGMGDKGGRPLFSKQEEQNLRDWGYNLDRLHKLEHKYKF